MRPVPEVSVLMPVYNTEHYLREAVYSILGQTFEDFEFVIIDDGSRDESLRILRELAQTDRRIRLITRENRGLVNTRNQLLQTARGEFVAWADSDDRYAHSRLMKQVERFRAERELVVLGTRWQMIDSEGLPIRTWSFPESHEEICRMMTDFDNVLMFPTIMMRRSAALKVGGFRHPFVIGEDYDINMRLSEIGRVANLPDRLCFYRQHFSSTVNSKLWQVRAYSALVRKLARERRTTGSDRLQRGEPVELEFDPALEQSESVQHLQAGWAWMALHNGYVDTARKHALLITARHPRRRENWNLLGCAIRGW